MKVVSQNTFLEYPAGTMYSRGKEWYFNNIEFKGDTILGYDQEPIDFYYIDLCWPELRNSNEAFDILPEALVTGKSFVSNSDFQRDGSFDVDELFLIFEQQDLFNFLALLNSAITLSYPRASNEE